MFYGLIDFKIETCPNSPQQQNRAVGAAAAAGVSWQDEARNCNLEHLQHRQHPTCVCVFDGIDWFPHTSSSFHTTTFHTRADTHTLSSIFYAEFVARNQQYIGRVYAISHWRWHLNVDTMPFFMLLFLSPHASFSFYLSHTHTDIQRKAQYFLPILCCALPLFTGLICASHPASQQTDWPHCSNRSSRLRTDNWKDSFFPENDSINCMMIEMIVAAIFISINCHWDRKK